MTRSFATGLIFAVLAMICGLYSCAQAQTPRYGISPFPPGPYVSKPSLPVKVCPEERITTVEQARVADKQACPVLEERDLLSPEVDHPGVSFCCGDASKESGYTTCGKADCK